MITAKITKSPVSARALTQRINRKLAKEGKKLFKSRGHGAINNLGEHHIVELNRNMIDDSHVNIESLGRELKVLAEWEILQD
jgi:hypothetical protein